MTKGGDSVKMGACPSAQDIASLVLSQLDGICHFPENFFQGESLREGDVEICKYIFCGEGKWEHLLRVGIFAGIHGDEIAGPLCLPRFVEALQKDPEIARGYVIFIYPICNPSGIYAGTRERDTWDLNRLFWKNTDIPEVRLLEAEIRELRFDGFIALHADIDSPGMYGFVKGAELTREVLKPALAAAEKHLETNRDNSIDGFDAYEGVITTGYPGILGAPPGTNPMPFEIVLETPGKAPVESQIQANVAALVAMLKAHREFISFAQDL